MSYDLIIVSASTSSVLIQYTQNAINTCIAEGKVKVILIETANPYKYQNVDKFIEYNGEFNYNRALNIGLKYAKSDFQILANNDIIFYPGWSKIGDIMRANDYLSASALNQYRSYKFKPGDVAYEGYGIGNQLAGWCIFTDKSLWKLIGKLDESHLFWFSDNMYGEQLKKAGIKHALICSVRVDHIGSQTLRRLDRNKMKLYTYAKDKRIGETDSKDLQA